MDTTNYKNRLQEYFQKKKLELPTYSYKKINQNWKASLRLSSDSKIYFGDECSSKIKTAQSVAKKVCLKLFGDTDFQENPIGTEDKSLECKVEYKPNDTLVINESSNPIYILVDFENTPHTDKLEALLPNNPSITLLKFASSNHSNLHKVDYLIPTKVRDATDHYISLYLGMLIATIKENLTVLILTKDHFGEILEIIYNKLENPNILVRDFSNQDEALEFISRKLLI